MNDFCVYKMGYPQEMGGKVFYIGKGQDTRVDAHLREARRGVQSLKCDAIREIWAAGYEVVHEIVARDLPGREAGNLERKLIQECGLENLTNQTNGGEGASFYKSEDERRIVVSFSISGIMLELFRRKLAAYMHMQPEEISVADIRVQVRELALSAIEAYNATEVPADPEWEADE